MIFKKRAITQSFLIYGYENEEHDEYCLSFLGVVHPAIDAVEFVNLISKKNLSLKDFKRLFQFVNSTVRELGYKKWFMDVLPENKNMAESFEPAWTQSAKVVGKDMIKYWYNVEEE